MAISHVKHAHCVVPYKHPMHCYVHMCSGRTCLGILKGCTIHAVRACRRVRAGMPAHLLA